MHMANVAVCEMIKKMLPNGLEITQHLPVHPSGIGGKSALRRRDPQHLADKESPVILSDSVNCVTFGHAFVCLSTGIGLLR